MSQPTEPVFFDDFVVGFPSSSQADERIFGWVWNRNGSSSDYFIQTSGNVEAKHPGVVDIRVAAAGSSSGISRGSPNGTIQLDPDLNFTYEIMLRLPQVSPTTNGYTLRVGLHDSYNASDANNGVYFEHIPEANPVWRCITNSGGTKTTLTTTQAVNAGQWIILRCEITGTSGAAFSIRSTTTGTLTSVGTNTTNINGGAQVSPNLRIYREGSTTVTYDALFDYWYHTYNFSTPR